MKNRLKEANDKIMLRKRSIIKTINDMLKDMAQIVHTRHRSLSNFIVMDYKLSKREETLNRIGFMRKTKSKLHLSENKWKLRTII